MVTIPAPSAEAKAFNSRATVVRSVMTLALLAVIGVELYDLVPTFQGVMVSAGRPMSRVSVMAVAFGRYFGWIALGLIGGLGWLHWQARRGGGPRPRVVAAHWTVNLLLVAYMAMVGMVFVDFDRSLDRAQQGGAAPLAPSPR